MAELLARKVEFRASTHLAKKVLRMEPKLVGAKDYTSKSRALR